MNTKVPFCFTVLTTFWIILIALLAEANPVMAGNSRFYQKGRDLNFSQLKSKNFSASNQQYSHASQSQQIILDLDVSDLKLSHLLEISAAPGVRLTGQVTVNGILIQELSSNWISINLSPYLRDGRQTVEISGRYRPARAAVQIEFSGPDTTIIQQTSGSGLLSHLLVFHIQ